jgi:phosphoglycerate dehydrogenase-like enzyme
MSCDVLCLRPRADFERVGVVPPASLRIVYAEPGDSRLGELLRGARALVLPAAGPKLPASLFEGCALALVQVTGAGVDRLDEPTLKRLGIPVANVPGGSNSAVAEYAVACAIVLLRRLAWADGEIRAGRYGAFRARMLADNLPGLEGLTAGIVGFGTIGAAVARAFRCFGCRIVYHDPAPRALEAAEDIGAQPLAFEELLGAADVVSLHVPLTERTRRMIGARELERMKPGAILLNAARGGVVDEAALAAALRAGRLGGAALDVHSEEPPRAESPLLALEGEAARRVLLTPHIAGVTRQSFAALFREAWANVERVLVRGEPPRHRVY